jgi:hypothetical protein
VSIENAKPADFYFDRAETILIKRLWIALPAIANWRLQTA